MATEENPAGVWTGTRFVLDCRTGADRSGNGFALTMSSVGAGDLIGDAGDYGGSSVANRADASSLAGLTALTLRCLIQPDAAMVGATKGWLCLNTPTGSDSTAALALQYLAASGAGIGNVIHAKIRTTTGNAYVISTADKHAAQRQLLHAVFQDGQAPKLYLDGTDISGDTAVQSGGLALGTGGLYLGLGPRDPVTGAWQGLLDELALIASAHTPARVAAEAKSWNAPRRFYAIGGENLAGDTNLAPIAPPMEIAATAGVETPDVDVIANGIDPGGGALTITGTPTSDNGTVRIVSSKLRGTASTAGLATWTYNLQEPGGKTCVGRVFATVAAPIITGRPKYPFGFTSWTAAPVARVRPVGFGVTGAPGPAGGYTSLANAYAAAAAGGGDFIVLADATYAENFDFNRNFPAANPVVITSRNVSNGRSPMANFTGLYTVSGAGHWFYEVRWTRTTPSGDGVPSTYTLGISASNITITRNWFNTPNGINVSDGADRANIKIGWNRFVTSADRIGAFIFIRVLNNLDLPTSKFRSSAVYNNYFNKTVPSLNGNDAYNLYIGNEHARPNTSAVLSEVYIEYNYLAGGNQMKMYLKRGITSLSYNHVVGGGQFGFRHGTVRYASPASLNTKDYPTGRAYGNRVIGANFTVAGAGCDIRGNYLDNSQGFIIFPGSENDPSRTTRGETQAASDALFVGNYVDRSNSEFAPYNFGYIDQTDDVLFEGGGGRIRNCNIWGHTGDTIQKTGPKSSGNIIYNAGFVDASTININAGIGSYTVPATITLNPNTDVGFQVANQNLTT